MSETIHPSSVFDGLRAVLDGFLAWCGSEEVVRDELVHALLDPEPWATVPSVEVPSALPALAMHPYTAHLRPVDLAPEQTVFRSLTVVVSLRLARLDVSEPQAPYGFAEYIVTSEHGVASWDESLALAGLSVETGRAWLLGAFGRWGRWVEASERPVVPGRWEAHLGAIDQALCRQLPDSRWPAGSQRIALELLAGLDGPLSLADRVRELTLAGSTESVRQRAVDLLTDDPDWPAWLVKRLRGGAAKARERAARLAPTVAGQAARDTLVQAARAEKVEAVRVAQIRSLQELGLSPSEVLDRDRLAAELQKKAKKGTLPDGFERSQLPELRWTDGSLVSDAIVVAWVSTCHKRRKADPTPMLALLAKGVDARSGAAFARALVGLWVALDEAGESSLDPGRTTGTAHRGLLALAAALGDASLLEPARAYITEHYGWRAAQSKAMVTMLAYVGTPETLQYLIALATRFRTRGIQKQARLELEGVAARRGWTAAELEDRTLLDGGLGEDGRLEVAYQHLDGSVSRRFHLRLGRSGPDVEVVDEEGRVVRGLPKGRASEDPDSEKAAKKTLRAARKAVRAFVSQQVDRLQRAMVAERCWSGELFTEVLVPHPILGQLVQRLVWMDAQGRTFRPTDDGALTTADSDRLQLAADAQVRLAHPLQLTSDARTSWTEHLSDYELVPPFEQLDRPVITPSGSELDATSLDLLAGHSMSALSLRSRGARVGFVLGPNEGGHVPQLVLELPHLSLQVCLEVEGLELPVSDVEVTLGSVTVERGGQPLPLSALPEVARSEVLVALRSLTPD